MSGSNPTITAVVTAIDEASPVLKKVFEEAKASSKAANAELNAASKKAQAEMTQNARHASQQVKEQAAHIKEGLSGLKDIMGGVGVSLQLGFAAATAAVLRNIMEVGAAMEKQAAKFEAYTNITPEQLAEVRMRADTTGAALPGGPEGAFSAARASAMSGVPARAAGVVSEYAQMFSYETGDDTAAAAEKLVSHTAMMGHLRDAQGHVIDFHHATNEQIKTALEETSNLLISVNRRAAGNANDVYQGFKYAGPSAVGFKIDSATVAAFYEQEANHGIKGDEAGVAFRAVAAGIAAPTAKARQTYASLGLDANNYRILSEGNLSGENIANGLKQRLGDAALKIKPALEHAVTQFKKDHSVAALNDAIVSSIQSTGVKTVQDRVKAANLGRQILDAYVVGIDVAKALKDIHDAGGGVGAYNQIFGSKQGSRVSVIDPANLDEATKVYRAEEHGNNYQTSKDKYQDSYKGATDYAGGSIKGMYDTIFQDVEPELKASLRQVGNMAQSITRNSKEALSAYFTGLGAPGLFAVALFGDKIAKLGNTVDEAGKSYREFATSTVAKLKASLGLGPDASDIPGTEKRIEGNKARIADMEYRASITEDIDDPDTAVANRITIERLKADVAESEAIVRKAMFGFSAISGSVASAAVSGGKVSMPAGQMGRDGYTPGWSYPDTPKLAPIGDVRKIAPLGLGFAPLPAADGPTAPRQMFGPEGSGAFATAGVNHESGIVKGIEGLLSMFSGEKGARYGGGREPAAPSQVQGEVSGSATIVQSIKVDASPLLVAIVNGAQAVSKMNLTGKLGSTMKGSNATLAPVAPGLTSFKPTLSGR